MATQISQTQTDDAAREVVSFDPATGEEIGRVPLCSPEDVAQVEDSSTGEFLRHVLPERAVAAA